MIYIPYDKRRKRNILDNSFSTHIYKFGKEKLGFRDLTIKFNHLNNYYSNTQIENR